MTVPCRCAILKYMNILQWIFNLVIWVVVPFIILVAIRFAYSAAYGAENVRVRTSTKSGFWAGFVLFIMALIYQVGVFIQDGYPDVPIYQGFSLPLALGVGVLTFMFLFGRRIFTGKLSGWAILLISFAGFYVFFQYLFVHTYNEQLLSAILGAVFGTLTHFAVFPSSLHEFLLEIK